MTREEAVKLLNQYNLYSPTKQIEEAIDMAIEALANPKSKFESADAVQGEWIRKEKEYNVCDGHRVVYWHECSVCGARPLYTRFVNEKLTNYCPNCGARIKGGAE